MQQLLSNQVRAGTRKDMGHGWESGNSPNTFLRSGPYHELSFSLSPHQPARSRTVLRAPDATCRAGLGAACRSRSLSCDGRLIAAS